MKLTDFLKQETQLSDESIIALDSLWDYQEHPKGALLLKEGSHSKKVFYIEKGLLRLYYVRDGKEITHHFFAERGIYVPIENVFLNQHFPYYLELLEDSVLRTIDYSVVEKQMETDIRLLQFSLYFATYSIKQMSEHIRSTQLQTAQERYSNLLKNNPNILQRAPLGHIASYLGITQQTLSVIRAEKMR